MYYYLFESIKTRSDQRLLDQTKRIVSELGIAGEFAMPTPARSIDELVEIALSKGYVTIVGCGFDLFANRIISSLLNRKEELEKRIVFGFIPKNFAQSQVGKIIGANSLRQACEILRSRHVKALPVGIISPNKFFITPLKLSAPQPFDLYAKFTDFEVKDTATDIVLSADVAIEWQNKLAAGGSLSKIFKFLIGKESENRTYSRFYGFDVSLETKVSLPFVLEDEIIAKTPLRVRRVEDVLHLIVSRDNITAERVKYNQA